jgi:hypothetical protein
MIKIKNEFTIKQQDNNIVKGFSKYIFISMCPAQLQVRQLILFIYTTQSNCSSKISDKLIALFISNAHIQNCEHTVR